jgi:hypothetical protein
MTNLTISNEKLLALIELEQRTRSARSVDGVSLRSQWFADRATYVNTDTNKPYVPHSENERQAVFSDEPRNVLFKGGEGSGKSVASIIKTLEKLRRGCNGMMLSPDFEQLKRSLWPEFRRWCPWQHVVPSQRRRANVEWEPTRPFTLVFQTPFGGYSSLLVGGAENPTALEGPNVNFAHLDEARRCKTPQQLKVLSGRVRIDVPFNGRVIKPQLYFSTVPSDNWLMDYFGPVVENDPLLDFKHKSFVVTMPTKDNQHNLTEDYTGDRGASLTEQEKKVLLLGEWGSIDDVERFIPDIHLWDILKREYPADHHAPCVLAVDAGVTDDSFAATLLSYYGAQADDIMCVQFCRVWEPHGAVLDYDAIEQELNDLIDTWAVQLITYDRFMLWHMMQRFEQRIWCDPFNQGDERATADKSLRDRIYARKIVHNGDPKLRQHVDNANARKDEIKTTARRIRLEKRTKPQKIDAAVCVSMGAHKLAQLSL